MRLFPLLLPLLAAFPALAADPVTVTCGAACTVTHVLSASDGSMSPERVQDYLALFSVFVVAAVAVLCARALYSYFRIDHHEA